MSARRAVWEVARREMVERSRSRVLQVSLAVLLIVSAGGAVAAARLSDRTPTDNIGVAGYPVERCVGAGCVDFVEIATVTGTSYLDSAPLATAQTYTYRVRASDVAGLLSSYSNTSTLILGGS